VVVIEGLGGVVRFRISDIDNLIHKSSLEASSATFTLYSSSGNYDMTLEVFTYTPYSDSRVPAHRRCCRGRPQHIYIPAHSTSRSRNFSTLQNLHRHQHHPHLSTLCKGQDELQSYNEYTAAASHGSDIGPSHYMPKAHTHQAISDGLYWNPLSETNMGGGDRIVLRSKPMYLRLLHTWSIMSTKIEVEMVVASSSQSS